MKLTQLFILTLISLAIGGCSTQRLATSYSFDQQTNEPEIITKSLFDTKNATLSEENIQRLLNGKIIIPDTIRIAIFKYASNSINRYYSNWWYDEEYLKVQQSYIDTLVDQIKESKRVKKVILMPSIMTSGSSDITQLRESAVRLQADMLLVFCVTSDIYYKYKAFQKDEAKAFATCETILMDIRTGVIPHSSVITREYFVKKQSTDLTLDETRKRAETGAVILTLIQAGRGVADFLDGK